ncbi:MULTISPECIES: ABC transporter substrate-binding protein [unclassified Bradyrhizobium]|uniref:ABC transporter substrate-binding protein n=1 Tax=unclassified Bradyrhizobium TaxID=2631580 RepID=UPI001FFA1CF2|nr:MULTISPECIES: ABC transporter substrate-binding protein [unclassified Bradyrhizobium]
MHVSVGSARSGTHKSLGLALALVTFAKSATAQNGPISLGVLTDMSSLYADNGGRGCVVAARMTVGDFKSKVLGRPIEIVARDHQNKADTGSTTVRRWLENDNVEAILDVPIRRADRAGHHPRQEEALSRRWGRHVPSDRRRVLAHRQSTGPTDTYAGAGDEEGDFTPLRQIMVLPLGRLGPSQLERRGQP